jgi:hypothetical protein
MSTNAFDFLWSDSTPKTDIKLPESGNGNNGMAGQWQCSVVFRFWHDQDIPKEDIAQVNGSFLGKKAYPSGAFYYFKTFDGASAVSKLAGRQFGPNTVWRWEIATADILNIDDDTRAKFGDTLTYEVNVVGLGIKKSRHELHMIALPSAIQALALMGGLIKEPVFDYESLRVDPHIVDEAYQTTVIGNDTSYENSNLWKARTQLWSLLGETDPKKYTVAQGGKFDTLSPLLAQCLNIVYRPTTIWARLINVPDPRVDALSNKEDDEGNKKRLAVPVIAQVWRNKESMLTDLDIDVKPQTAAAQTNGTITNANGLVIPQMWKDYPADWKACVKEIIGTYNGKPKPVILQALKGREQELMTNYGASPDEFMAWADHV